MTCWNDVYDESGRAHYLIWSCEMWRDDGGQNNWTIAHSMQLFRHFSLTFFIAPFQVCTRTSCAFFMELLTILLHINCQKEILWEKSFVLGALVWKRTKNNTLSWSRLDIFQTFWAADRLMCWAFCSETVCSYKKSNRKPMHDSHFSISNQETDIALFRFLLFLFSLKMLN